MAVKHHNRDGDPGLICCQNHWELLLSSGHLPSHIGIARRRRHDNNNNNNNSCSMHHCGCMQLVITEIYKCTVGISRGTWSTNLYWGFSLARIICTLWRINIDQPSTRLIIVCPFEKFWIPNRHDPVCYQNLLDRILGHVHRCKRKLHQNLLITFWMMSWTDTQPWKSMIFVFIGCNNWEFLYYMICNWYWLMHVWC